MQFVAPSVEILLGFVLDFYELILLDELVVFVGLVAFELDLLAAVLQLNIVVAIETGLDLALVVEVSDVVLEGDWGELDVFAFGIRADK
jgi:hypothetical protein